MAKIISIATALPPHKHQQEDILQFMNLAYNINDQEKRILRYLYRHSGIDTRYSVIADYTQPMDSWTFFPKSADLEPFPTLEQRMNVFLKQAPVLSVQAITKCLDGHLQKEELTHLITVSCTGMSAPGLEMQLMEMMQLPRHINRNAINFMGCYAAILALRQATDIVNAQPDAKVMIVCTELCTLHFQKEYSEATVAAPLIFGDGCAAVLVAGNDVAEKGILLDSFYAEVMWNAKDAMSWDLGSHGFNMKLSGEVPDMIKQDLAPLQLRALEKAGLKNEDIRHWCIHPGGVKILEAVSAALSVTKEALEPSYRVLREHGNMSSATILFVLKEMWPQLLEHSGEAIFAAAFGPGLTMESMIMRVS